jgi:hypothetical protein
MNLPDYGFLSAPLWLITVLHILTLTLHLIAMNFIVGGLITILFGKLTGKWHHPTVQRYLKLLPTVMATTISFGVAPLLFLQLVYHHQVYSAAIISGWFWLSIVAALMVSYYLLYGASFSRNRPAGKTVVLGLSLAGLAYISYVYSSIFSMAERPDLMKALYSNTQSGWLLNPDVGSYLIRWLHMVTGAVTVGGFFVGLVGRNNDEAYLVGRRFFLWGMAAAALFGLIYLFTLGEDLSGFMRTPGVWTLTLGIVLSAASLHFYFKKKFLVASLMLFVSVLTMVVTRHYLRLLRLEEHFQPAAIPVKPQWTVFIIFLIFLAVAVALIWYMLRLFFSKQETAAQP